MFKFPKPKRILLLFAVTLAAGVAAFFVFVARETPAANPSTVFGVTFSDQYARSLGIDWKAAFTAMLDDLQVRHLRIPVYWDDVESVRGTYDWSNADWMLSEAAKRHADVILVVGRKVPRWPECHPPDWAKSLGNRSQDLRVLDLVGAEIRHFKDAPVVRWWQVENEPLFYFGVCPPPDRDFLKKEVDLVRSLDDRPVMITDSGELSTWVRTATISDILGISMYRLVWNKYLGFLFWPISPRYYSDHVALIKSVTNVKDVIISELQAEPWFSKGFDKTTLQEQYESMDLARFRSNVDFARRTGASEIYLWGAEWWYWLKGKGHDDFWEAARPLFP